MPQTIENKIPAIKILLVEDNPGDVHLIREAFRACVRPIRIDRVRDGEEAISYLKGVEDAPSANRPDLVILDLNIPKKDGFQVLGEIKSDIRLRNIPVIILSNSYLEDDVRRAYEARANFYMVKPTDMEELYRVVRKVEDLWFGSVGEGED